MTCVLCCRDTLGNDGAVKSRTPTRCRSEPLPFPSHWHFNETWSRDPGSGVQTAGGPVPLRAHLLHRRALGRVSDTVRRDLCSECCCNTVCSYLCLRYIPDSCDRMLIFLKRNSQSHKDIGVVCSQAKFNFTEHGNPKCPPPSATESLVPIASLLPSPPQIRQRARRREGAAVAPRHAHPPYRSFPPVPPSPL